MRPDLLDWLLALVALDIVALFLGFASFLIARHNAGEERDICAKHR